jgi:membrane-associated protease RseP (regulator of RpoE activity)
MDSPHNAVNSHPAPPPPASPEASRPQAEKLPWVLAEPEERGDDFKGQTNPMGLVGIAALFALLWFGAGPRYFLVVLGLVVMIFLHELGHYMTAKWTGMKVTQFFLFMGPRIWSFRRGETEYGVRLFPVGAFVRIVGMNNLDPCDPEDEPRAYRNKSYPRRLLVISAGSIMHFIQALILFVIVTSLIGVNDPAKWSVGRVSALTDQATPAVEAGLVPGDDIIAIDGVDTTQWDETVEYIQDRPGQQVTLTVVRGAETLTETVTLAEVDAVDGDGTSGFLGVGPDFERTRQSPIEGVKLLGETTWTALTSIPQFLSPSTLGQLATLLFSGSEDVSLDSEEAQRPVSVVGAVRLAGQPDFDVTVPLTLLGVFNVFIGILNMLPLLPLDGGHAAIATYERIRSRKGYRHQVDVAKLLPVAYAVVGLLGFIMVSTVILDIVRPIG